MTDTYIKEYSSTSKSFQIDIPKTTQNVYILIILLSMEDHDIAESLNAALPNITLIGCVYVKLGYQFFRRNFSFQ